MRGKRFIPAKCPNCGGAIEFPPDRDTMYCIYCGTNIVMEEQYPGGGGTPISGEAGNILRLADELFAMGNYDEALGYYNRALELDVRLWQAWLGRGRAQGWLSGPADFKIEEMLKSFEKAAHFAPIDCKGTVEKRRLSYITEIIDHFTAEDFIKGTTYDEFRLKASFVLETMVLICENRPKDAEMLKRAIDYTEAAYNRNDRYYDDGQNSFKSYILRKRGIFKDRLLSLDPTAEIPKLGEEEVGFFDTNACLVLYISGTILFVILIALLSSSSC